MNSGFSRVDRRDLVEITLSAIPVLVEQFWDNRSQVLSLFYGDLFDNCEVCRRTIAAPMEQRWTTPTHFMVHQETTFALKVDASNVQDLRGLAECMTSSMSGDVAMMETLRDDWRKLHLHAATHPGRGTYTEVVKLNNMALRNESVRNRVMTLKRATRDALKDIADFLDAGRFDTAQLRADQTFAQIAQGFTEIIDSYIGFTPLPH